MSYNKTYKGSFRPKNKHKYKGNSSNIIYRSSWEKRFMIYCDTNKNIIEWSSEEIVIPYRSPFDDKIHRYYVDFYCEYIDKKGLRKKSLIEIKPKKQTRPPTKQKRKTKRYLNEMKTWGINKSKWTAAKKICKKNGWDFLILTEDTLL